MMESMKQRVVLNFIDAIPCNKDLKEGISRNHRANTNINANEITTLESLVIFRVILFIGKR